MSRGALIHHIAAAERYVEHSLAWAAAVTILFATIAAISFAVDVSVSLSDLPPAR